MRRLAVVSPLFPTLEEPHRGQPIYHTVLELERMGKFQIEVFSPLGTYPDFLDRPYSRGQVEALKDYSPPGLRAHYLSYPTLPAVGRPFNGLLSRRALAPHLTRFRPDLILAYWIYPEGYGAVSIGKRLGVPVIIGARGSDLRWIQDRISRFWVQQTLMAASAVLTVSSELREHAIRLGVDGARAHTILNGCDAATFHYRPRDEARTRLGISLSERMILYVGRLSAAKGIRELLQAIALLVRKDPSIHLYCIGEGKLSASFRDYTATLSLGGHVHFLGTRLSPEVAEWMAAADVFCLPSYTEGCPNVVIEASTSGTPVVATDVGGIPELVNDQTGLLVKPYDPAGLAGALTQALSRTWDRVLISRQFRRGWDSVANETNEICEMLLRQRLPQ